MKMVLLLLGVYAIACAIATFIEKYMGTMAARLYVYDAFWFEVLHLWLLLCLLGCFITSKAWERKKYASLCLHAAFVVIILGAGITRYYGFEGLMSIKEGQSERIIATNTHYIFIQVKDPSGNTEFVKLPTYINDKVNRNIHQRLSFFGKDFMLDSGEVTTMGNANVFLLDINIKFLDSSIATQVVREGDSAPSKDSITMLESNGYKIFLAWGVDNIPLPFALRLKKFELERYPGSQSPASYASEVEVLDGDKPPMPFRIYMNNVLDYGGYRFFQSSYFPDESGTILSVNNDPGKIPTYIGYAMLIFGTIWLLFDKYGRFRILGRFLKAQKFLSIAMLITLCATLPMEIKAESSQNDSFVPEEQIPPSEEAIKAMVSALQSSKEVAKAFDNLLVQDFGGRTKPLNTLANEYIHKIIQKDSFLGLNPTQILLGMIFYPQEWQSIQMIATKSPKLRQILGLDESKKYIAYIDVFSKDGRYILQNYVESANLTPQANRDTFQKDVIALDERINYAFLIYTGQVLRIFPDSKAENNQWLYPLEAISSAVAQGDMERARALMDIYKSFAEGMQSGINSATSNTLNANNWQMALDAISAISALQRDSNAPNLISQAKIDSEIWLNTYNPFHTLTYPYIIISLILFFIILSGIIKNVPISAKTHKVFYALFLILFIIHTLGLIMRWYVSGHAPWSNAYESMLYIAWAAILSGVVCFRHSNLALCASSFLAGITLFVAHLGFMDPQIGNLVPVLKSYWLNIHVSVITASYGFLGLCFMLGLITLLMFILRNNALLSKSGAESRNKRIESAILSLSALNEMSMILGLFLLAVGNFLGGIWANESWGRYWGWDSKETWALISIGVYAIILHLRLIVRANYPFIFASASVIGFFSILMTYFGVNFYLSGMHSYAAGEAPPMPLWVKLMIVLIALLIIFASRHRKLDMPKLEA